MHEMSTHRNYLKRPRLDNWNTRRATVDVYGRVAGSLINPPDRK